MSTLSNLLVQVFRWLGILLFDPFENKADAGHPPHDYDPKLHRMVVALRGAIASPFKDCLVVDVSKWQGEIDFKKLRASGVKGVIMKAGQGTALDPRFIENWAKAKAAGLLRGSYWYFDSRIAPERQATLWANVLLVHGLGELPHFGDYEENYGGDFRGIVNFSFLMLKFEELTKLPKSRLGVYTGYFYWNTHGSFDSRWSEYWLWIAWYGNEMDVLLPKPWTQGRLWAWQFTDKGDGKAMGVSSFELDLNWFVKGLAVYEGLYGDTGEVPQNPDTGAKGMFKVWSESYNMSLRKAASATSDRLEAFPIGTVFMCDRIDVPPTSGGLSTDKWAHVVSVNGVAKDGWVAQVHDGKLYCKAEALEQGTNPRVTVIYTDPNQKVWMAENVELLPK